MTPPPDNAATVNMNMIVHLELTDEDVTALAAENGLDVEAVRAVISAWVAKRRLNRDELRDQLAHTRHTLDRARAAWRATEAVLDGDIGWVAPADMSGMERFEAAGTEATKRLNVVRATMRGALGTYDATLAVAETRLAHRTALALVDALVALNNDDEEPAERILEAVLADPRINERAPEMVMPLIEAVTPALAHVLPQILNEADTDA